MALSYANHQLTILFAMRTYLNLFARNATPRFDSEYIGVVMSQLSGFKSSRMCGEHSGSSLIQFNLTVCPSCVYALPDRTYLNLFKWLRQRLITPPAYQAYHRHCGGIPQQSGLFISLCFVHLDHRSEFTKIHLWIVGLLNSHYGQINVYILEVNTLFSTFVNCFGWA